MMTLINDRTRDKELGEWIGEKVAVDYTPGNPCFGTESDGKVIGAVMLSDWNGSNVNIHQRMESPHAITRDLLFITFNYVFNYLKARRLSGSVIGNNYKAIALNLKLGFELEGVFKDHFPGPEGTITHFVMWPEKCRYLRGAYAA